MDDRAKIVQYFTRPVNGAGDIAGAVESIKIEEMFGKCWGVPCQVFLYSKLKHCILEIFI